MSSTPGTITICRADELVDKVAALKPAAVLSIEHPGVIEGGPGYTPRLKDGTPQMILTFWDSETPVKQGPDRAQIKQGLEFVLKHIQEGDVIIHCHSGKARSTALALGVLAALHPEETEEELINTLLAIRPTAAPNIIVVGIVDELTGRHGKLLQAVKDNAQMTAARDEAEGNRAAWRARHPEKFPPAGTQRPPQP
jgi:predicted protein tyrosine phosphatase